MTLDDLVKLYEDHRDCIKVNSHAHAMRVVVAALRDELQFWENDCHACDRASDTFRELLADGEVAAGGPTREDGRLGGLEHPSGHSTPAADVCEWNPDGRNLWFARCEKQMGHRSFSVAPTHCPSCGKPIKFVEVKP